MCAPPMWTDRSGLRAWMSNSRGALAICSRMNSGSSLTLLPSTFWPALRHSSSHSSSRNSAPSADTIRRPGRDRAAERGHDPRPAAVARVHRLLAEDLVAGHLVDEHFGYLLALD